MILSDTPETAPAPVRRPWSRAAIPIVAAAIGGVLLVVGTALSVGGVLWAGRITDKVLGP